ncbi:DivIVA domain-containing protein [Arthrobacter sp. Leaf234]|uniref:DivIVA domain-containing protein n=1 Tax=Arthrobacter sp. Leaf234 TaxID=1736303 RepID=UPI000A489F5D|nr:DivIVA domain-containing protein [Arthrobacter sp. Leaf234]
MTIFLVILAIVLVGATALLASGREVPAVLRPRGARRAKPSVLRRAADGPDDAAGRDPAGTPTGDDDSRLLTPGSDEDPSARRDGLGLVEPVASLPPVLLPDDPSGTDVDAVRFGLGLRGYRMDQVDEVLDRLSSALEARDATIRALRAELAGRDGRR